MGLLFHHTGAGWEYDHRQREVMAGSSGLTWAHIQVSSRSSSVSWKVTLSDTPFSYLRNDDKNYYLSNRAVGRIR